MHDDAKWVEGFPNLKTMWGYAGFSPLAPTGHLTQWERLTRGRADHLSDSSVRQSTAAVAWSARGGVVLPGATAGDLGAARALADLRFEEFLSGATPVKTPDDERARHTYSTYRVLSRHPDTPRDERAKLAARADQMVRIRFYETAVREAFQRAHSADVAEGYRSLGLPVPDFSKLDRRVGLRHVAAFQEKLRRANRVPHGVAKVARAIEGLRVLDRNVIPDDWLR